MEIENLDLELRKMDFRNAPHTERKPLRIVRNCIDVSPDQEIWKIFNASFLLKDLENKTITLPEISTKGVGKKLSKSGENPFLGHEFRLENGYPVYLAFLKDYYGICWSEKALHERWAWKEFAGNDDGLLVKSTVGKIMHELMNLNNRFYELNYFCGKVIYDTDDNLASWKNGSLYTDFLGSQGFESLQALLRLPEDFNREQEVRFVYRCPENNPDFPDAKVIQRDDINLCRHPFVWNDAIDEIHIDPRISRVKQAHYVQELQKLSLTCQIIDI